MWKRLTFYSLLSRCCAAIVGLTPCPYLLLTHFPRCCCVTWVVNVLFFFQAVHRPGSARGLERCPPFNCQASQPALNPFSVQHELSLLPSAPPCTQDRTHMPFEYLSPLILSFLTNDQQADSWLEYSSHCPCLFSLIPPTLTRLQHPHIHAPNSPKLFGFVVTQQSTGSSGALMHCQLLYVLPKLLHLVPQELLHTFITRCLEPGGCLCKSSFS